MTNSQSQPIVPVTFRVGDKVTDYAKPYGDKPETRHGKGGRRPSDYFCEACQKQVMKSHKCPGPKPEPEHNRVGMEIPHGKIWIPDVLIIGNGDGQSNQMPGRMRFTGMFYGEPDR